ncbi:hypothetical protein HN014_01140 [Aquimarina sp. TRL1]|uniref:PKD domain-containing protein n=1 Tax=Aquimarina sp. (strain TRL1) TaxID=2736252 RepID=UPI00158ABCD1|nr:PKD domain-containing protein [Aquimarina sp. TRL1]QKX03574.1 hypothetical protein HN014_01140 [Aquimarina sp. TRL1]
MKYLITTVLFFLLRIIAFSQEGESTTQPPAIFPTSPEAASLGKYGEIPVNLSTGRINHTIPLHTINEAGFRLPISLSYNYSGLMVDEIPGATGLGWDFSGKGMITRQVRGLADESQLGYIGPNKIGEKVHKFHTNSHNMSSEELGVLIRESAAGKWDTESDKYMISVGSLSATFYFNHNGEAVFAPYKNYKLTRLPNNGGFKLIDDSGIIYYFELQETTEIETLSATEPTITIYPSAWVITKIELPNTKTITFQYQNYRVRQRTHADTWTLVDIGSPDYQRCVQERSLNSVSHSFSDNQTSGLLPSKIITPSETIDLTYSIPSSVTLNQNLTTLDAVTITNSIGQKVMEYTLGYNNKTSPRKVLTTINRRKNSVSKYQEYYRFEYYGNPPTDIAYYKQDYWGYYSGSTNNTGSLISENSNRSPNFNNTQQGALKKIYYPTKGYSEFIYEQNQVFGKLDTGEIGNEARLDFSVNEVITSDSYALDENINKTIRVPFSPKPLPGGGAIKVSLGYYLHTSMGYSLASVELKKVGAGMFVHCTGERNGTCNYKTEISSAEQEPVTKQQDQTLYTLEPGDYELIVRLERIAAPSNPDRTPRAIANVLLKYYSGTPAAEPEVINIPFGGLRIKEVNSYDSQGGRTTKRYSYLKEDGVTSSGINLSKPVFVNKESHHYLPDLTPHGRPKMDCNLTRRLSSSVIPLSTYIGSPVLYTTVEEQLVNDNNEILKSRFYFSGATDVTESFPYAPTEKKNWRKGLTLQQQSYIKNGNTFEINGKISNIYKSLERYTGTLSHLNSYNLKAGKVRYTFDAAGHPLTASSGLNNSQYTRYVNRSELYPVITSKQEEIHHGQTITKDIVYTYDRPYGQLKKQVTTDSQNNEISSTYLYPYDKAGAVNNTLRHQNRISTAIEVSTARNNELLQTQSTEFKNWENGLLLPSYTKVAKGNKEAVVTLRYHRYDETGNPIEVSRENGSSQVLIWGYQNQLPVAKIENASYNDIAPYIASLKTASNADTDHCRQPGCKEQLLREALDNVREQFPDAMVTTYTYDPLIGVTSITDPRGNTIYHTYDAFNRLSYTEDHNGHVLQKYSYNYDGEKEATYGAFSIAIDGATQGQPEQAIPYTASVSRNGNSGRFIYTWWVDNIEVSCGVQSQINRTFNQQGNHQIRLKVVDTQTKEAKTVSKNIQIAYPALQTPVVTASSTHTIKGTPIVFTTTSGGGSGSLQYQWYVNNSLQHDTDSRFDFSNSTVGTYSVYCKVTDTKTGTSKNSAVKKVYTYNALSTPELTVSKTEVIKGTKVTYTASGISGGSGSYTYQWYVNNSLQNVNSTTLSYTHTTTGAFSVYLKVVDTKVASHTKNTTTKKVNVYNSLATPGVYPSHRHFTKGTSVSFPTSNVAGGSGHRRYQWYINNTLQAYTGVKLVHSFASAGTYTIRFRVIDKKVSDHSKEESVTIYAYPPLSTPTVSATKTHINQGTNTTFRVNNISGGSGSRKIEWYVNNVKQSASSTSYSYNFPNSGTYTIKCKVIDLKLQNENYKWSSNSPVLKVYPKMIMRTSQSATSVSGTYPSVSFQVTSLSGGSGSRTQVSWKAFKSISPSKVLGTGSGSQFHFSNFETGTHEYNITATVTDKLTGQQVRNLMVVIGSVSSDNGGGDGNTGDQH